MKTKTMIIVTGMLLPILSVKAQTIRPLNIGDTVPDIVLHNVINYKDSVIRLSEFKGKLVILDFWATWCTSCIDHFPSMDSMSAKYPDKIAIIGVGHESYDKIRKFFVTKKAPSGKPYRLASITEDNILSGYFPHRTVPHVVWIKPDGTIGAVTSGKDLTESNMLKMLNGDPLQVRTKKDVDVRIPLHLDTGFAYRDSLMGYTILYRAHDPGTGKVNITRKIGGKAIGKVLTNHTLLDMYRLLAYPTFLAKGQKLTSRQVFVSVPDAEAAKLNELHCFDFIVPKSMEDSLNTYAIEELNRLTGFRAEVKKHRTRCLVLKRTANKDLPLSKGTDRISRLLFDGQETYMRGCPLQMLADRLNELPTVTMPVVDGTGSREKLDITLSGSNEIADIRRDLARQGFSLVEEYRETWALVVTRAVNR